MALTMQRRCTMTPRLRLGDRKPKPKPKPKPPLHMGADPQEADAEPAQTAQAGQETTEPAAGADEAAETAAENMDENAKSANPQELQ